jgi:hypothetical protein
MPRGWLVPPTSLLGPGSRHCYGIITQVILAEVPGFGIACEMGSAEKSRNLFANVQLACRIGLLADAHGPVILAFPHFRLHVGSNSELSGHSQVDGDTI